MKRLKNTLEKMAALNIKNNKILLTHSERHEELFLNLDAFITGTVFRSKKNINQLSELAREYGIDVDDIRFDCLERCISKLQLVLANDIEAQIPYMYTVCNRIIVDYFRNAVKYASTTVSLNEELNNHNGKDDSQKTKSLEDFTMDTKANTESNYVAKTQVFEILNKYSSNADSLLCAIATKIAGDKPAELAEVIISEGSVEKALALYLQGVQEEFDIGYEELPTLPHVKNTGLSKLISNNTSVSSKTVSAKISNILHRSK